MFVINSLHTFNIMNLSKTLFWDTDFEKISFETDGKFVIPRTFMKGTFNDFLQVLNYYGKQTCAEILLNTRYLDKKTLAFCCTLFNLKKEDFRCYKLNQSIPKLWNY